MSMWWGKGHALPPKTGSDFIPRLNLIHSMSVPQTHSVFRGVTLNHCIYINLRALNNSQPCHFPHLQFQTMWVKSRHVTAERLHLFPESTAQTKAKGAEQQMAADVNQFFRDGRCLSLCSETLWGSVGLIGHLLSDLWHQYKTSCDSAFLLHI